MMKRFYGIFAMVCFFAVSVLGCGKTETGSCRQISSPFQMKQAAMFDEDCGWGLSDDNEALFTDSGAENFTSVKK